MLDHSVSNLIYRIQVNDTSGNYVRGVQQSIPVYDNDMPDITDVIAYPNLQRAGYYVNISCEVTDNIGVNIVKVNITYPDGSIINVSMSGGSYYYNVTYAQTGTYNYFIWANDTSGNCNSSPAYQFEVVGNIPPVADFSYTPSHPTTQDIIQFTDSSTDTDGIIVNWIWMFGDGIVSYKQNPCHQYSYGGAYNVTLTVTDNEGASNSLIKVITVKTPNSPRPPTPPDTTIIFDGPHEWNITHWEITKETKMLFKVNTHGHGLKETRYKVGKGNWTVFTNPFTIAEEGMYDVFYYSIDEYDVYETVNAVWIEVVSSLSPTTTCVLNPSQPDGNNGWYRHDVIITLTATDEISRVDSTYYKIDDSNWREYTEPIILSEEEHIISFYSIDKAGNKEKEKSLSIKIDKTKPSIEFKKPTYGHFYFLGKEILPLKHTVIIGKAMIKIDAYDEISGIGRVEFYVDGGLKEIATKKPYEWVWDERVFGIHILQAIAYDNAGNIASDEQQVWILNI